MPRMLRGWPAYGLSAVSVAIPFAFAVIRALRTGYDLRYLWVAIASLLGAAATLIVLRAFARRPTGAIMTVSSFVVATTVAVLAASLVGAGLGVGALIVGASFGFWFAVAGFLLTCAIA